MAAQWETMTAQFEERCAEKGWELHSAPSLCLWSVDADAGRVIVAAGPQGFTVHPMGEGTDAAAEVAAALFPGQPTRVNGRTIEVRAAVAPEFGEMVQGWYRDDALRHVRPVFECLRCGHSWMPRMRADGSYKPPQRCPRCQSRDIVPGA